MHANKQHLAKTRIYDTKLKTHHIRVQPGEFYVSEKPDAIMVTVLGSCVSACIRNPFNGYGGMNHFMLPESEDGNWSGTSSVMRYGNHAMETLINEVLKSGCSRHQLEIKLFGGANMFDSRQAVGSQNAQFARDYLENEGLKLTASDLGGNFGRRIHYTPNNGKVSRLILSQTQATTVERSELSYKSKLIKKPVEGDIELFS